MQLTTRTIEYSIGQTQPLVGSNPVPTTTTRLAGISRVHSYILASGPFLSLCLDANHAAEPTPCRVRYGLGQTVIVYHPVHFQIFYRNKPELVDNASTMLVRKIVPAPRSSFMHSSHNLTPLSPFGSAFPLLGKKALHSSQSLLLHTEEARVLNLLPIRERGERIQSNINPDLFIGYGQRSGFPLAGDCGVPLSCATPFDAHSLGGTGKGAMQHYLYWSDFRKMKGVPNQLTTGRGLRIAQRVVPKPATKSGVSRGIPSLRSAEESLEGEINPDGDILQHLAVNKPEGRTLLLQGGEVRLLVEQRGDIAACFMCILTLCKQIIVEPATLIKHITKLSGLLTSWIYAVEESFTHFFIKEQNYCFSNLYRV
jgi:hypothetical protein